MAGWTRGWALFLFAFSPSGVPPYTLPDPPLSITQSTPDTLQGTLEEVGEAFRQDLERAIGVKLRYCAPDRSRWAFGWSSMPLEAPVDPYLSQEDQWQATTQWLLARFQEEGPFPRVYMVGETELVFDHGRGDHSDLTSQEIERRSSRKTFKWDPEREELHTYVEIPQSWNLDFPTEVEELDTPQARGAPRFGGEAGSLGRFWLEVVVPMPIGEARHHQLLDPNTILSSTFTFQLTPGGNPRVPPWHSLPEPAWGCWHATASGELLEWRILSPEGLVSTSASR